MHPLEEHWGLIVEAYLTRQLTLHEVVESFHELATTRGVREPVYRFSFGLYAMCAAALPRNVLPRDHHV